MQGYSDVLMVSELSELLLSKDFSIKIRFARSFLQ